MTNKKKRYDDIAIVMAFPDSWAKGEIIAKLKEGHFDIE